MKKRQEQRAAKKKSKTVKPKQGTGLSREGGQEDLTYVKLNSFKKKIPNSEQKKLNAITQEYS